MQDVASRFGSIFVKMFARLLMNPAGYFEQPFYHYHFSAADSRRVYGNRVGLHCFRVQHVQHVVCEHCEKETEVDKCEKYIGR